MMDRVIKVTPWLGPQWMQIFPPPRSGRTMEGHSHPQNSLFEDRVIGVGQVSSFCSYQGGDRVLAQQYTVAVPMRSNWSGVPSRIPLVG